MNTINQYSELWFDFMRNSLIEASLVLLVVMLIWVMFRKRMSANFGYGLFLLVLLKLFVPLEIHVPYEWRYVSPEHTINHVTKWVTPESVMTPERVYSMERHFGQTHSTPGDVNVTNSANSANVNRNVQGLSQSESYFTQNQSAIQTSSAAPPVVKLSYQSWLMIGWVIICCLLLLLFLVVQWKTIRLLNQSETCKSFDDSEWKRLKSLANVKPSVELLENSSLPSPSAWGVLRPKVIVPQGIGDYLSPAKVRWVLLHELAHIRRKDLVVTFFQRLTQILFFFHPAVWISNYFIYQYREYACDDFALSFCESSRRECGEGLLDVAEQAAMGPEPFSHALGLLDRQGFLMHRLRRIMDLKRPVYLRLSWSSMIVLGIIALAMLPIFKTQQNVSAQSGSSEEIAIKEVAPPNAPLLSGTVLDAESNQTIQGAVVRLVKPEIGVFGSYGSINDGNQVAESITNEDGIYQFNDVDEGDYYLYAQSERHTNYILDINSIPYLEIDEQHRGQQLNFKMQPGRMAQLTVKNQSGQLLPEAYVKIFTSRMDYFYPESSTNADGQTTFSNLPNDKVRAYVYKDGYGETYSHEFLPGETPTEVPVTLGAPSSVSGKVTLEDGTPVSNEIVSTYDRQVDNIYQTSTDENGNYHLEGLGKSTYRLRVGEPNTPLLRVNENEKPKISYMIMENYSTELYFGEYKTEFDIKVRINEFDAEAKGKVVDTNGNPVPHASIELRSTNSQTHQVFAQTDEQGNFDIQNIDDWEKATFHVRKKGYLGYSESHTADEQPITITLQLAASLQGQIYNEDGEPIANAVVYLQGPGRHPSASALRRGIARTISGYDGRYEINYINEGYFDIIVEKEGYQNVIISDNEFNSGEVVQKNIQIEQGIIVTGLVVDGQGNPIPNAVIGLRSKAKIDSESVIGFSIPSTLTDTVESDEDGMFKISGIGSEGDELIVQHKDFAPQRIKYEPEENDNSLLNITMTKGGTIEGTVSDLEGNPLHGAQVQIFNFPENLYTYELHTDENGYYKKEHLPIAEFYVRKYYNLGFDYMGNPVSGTYENRTLTVEEGKVHEVSFGFGAGPTIRGVLTNDAGEPLPDVKVTVQDSYQSTMMVEKETVTGHNGEFELIGVPPGEWILAFSDQPHDSRRMSGPGSNNFKKINVPQDVEEITVNLIANSHQVFIKTIDAMTGEPLPEVMLKTQVDRDNHLPYPLHFNGQTKEDGWSLIHAKEPHTYHLAAIKNGYTTTFFDVNVPPLEANQHVSAVTQVIELEPSRTMIEVHLFHEGEPWTDHVGRAQIMKDGKRFPVSMTPVEDKTGIYQIAGAPEGQITITTSGTQKANVFELIRFQSMPTEIQLQNDQPYTLMVDLQRFEHYQIRFKTPDRQYYLGDVTFKIPDYPQLNQLYQNESTREYGAHLLIPTGQYPVQAIVPGYQPIEFNPGKMRLSGAELIQLELQEN